jgi:hypothetical protein
LLTFHNAPSTTIEFEKFRRLRGCSPGLCLRPGGIRQHRIRELDLSQR